MIRFLDFILALTLIVTTSPILFVISLVLLVTGEREVIFLQERGRGINKNFKLMKFVTMLKNSPRIGTGDITTKDDPRVLPFGKILRKTKINELPQLFNILFGDMSFVGPRPQTEKIFNYYTHDHRAIISQVRPGLTGIASIVFRDEESLLRHEIDPISIEQIYREQIIPYKAALDEWYVQKECVRNYLLIIALTAWVVVFPKSTIYTKIWKDLPKELVTQ